MKPKQTIVITGGHITPALSLIDALHHYDNLKLIFIGRKYAMEGSHIISFEYQLITQKGIPFIPITAGRIQRQLTWLTITALVKIPVSIIQGLIFCLREHPSLIVSFGGYVALPVAIAAWFCRIPVISHEQTLVPGLANKIITRIARRLCVAFPDTVRYFPKEKVVYTGLPMREELFDPPKKSPFAADINHFPLLYITGGGTGAQTLNRLVFPALPSLLKKYIIIHQVGETSFEEAIIIKNGLKDEYNNRYIVESYLPVQKLSWIFAHAVLVVGRSGANTILELAALGKPAVLVPLPWSGGGEQQKNAEWLATNGGAVVGNQNELTSEILLTTIEDALKNISVLQSRAQAFAANVPRDGTKRLLLEIEHLLPMSL